jgi:hypothetical protein
MQRPTVDLVFDHCSEFHRHGVASSLPLHKHEIQDLAIFHVASGHADGSARPPTPPPGTLPNSYLAPSVAIEPFDRSNHSFDSLQQ